MKVSYFLFCSLIFLLAGCYSESPSSSTQKTSTRKMDLQFRGINYQQVDKKKSIDIDQSITGFPGPANGKSFQVDSQCRSMDFEISSAKVWIEGVEFFAIKDVLPPEVFIPTRRKEGKFLCDFQVNVFDSKKENIHSISLKAIHVVNIENYVNYNIDWEETAQPFEDGSLFVFRESIENLKIVRPIDEGYSLTLCEDSKKTLSFDDKHAFSTLLPMGEFFDDSLFGSNNVVACRLVFVQENPTRIWVGDSFLIQNKKPKIHYVYEPNYKMEKYTNHWKLESMGRLTVQNESEVVTYLKMSELQTQVDVIAVYSIPENGINYGSNTVELHAWWSVENGITVERAEDLSFSIYRLEPGQSLEVSLNTDHGFSCSLGVNLTSAVFQPLPGRVHEGLKTAFMSDSEIHEEWGIHDSGRYEDMRMYDNKDYNLDSMEDRIDFEMRTSNCDEIYRLTGGLYHLNQFPQVTYNLFTTMDYQDWHSLSLEKLLVTYDDQPFFQWVPNYDVCPKRDVKENLWNFPIQATDPKLADDFWCRVKIY